MLGPMHPVLAVAFGLYLLNLAVGVAAQLRLARFGVWHHVLYFGVFASAVAALVLAQEAWLAYFPRARPRTWLHPALGAVGLVGYLLAVGV